MNKFEKKILEIAGERIRDLIDFIAVGDSLLLAARLRGDEYVLEGQCSYSVAEIRTRNKIANKTLKLNSEIIERLHEHKGKK